MLVFLVYEPLQRGRPEVHAVVLALLDIRLRMTEATARLSSEVGIARQKKEPKKKGCRSKDTRMYVRKQRHEGLIHY